ncbi:MAG: hypothetical protein EA412_09630 [Chitinophagaceae bacterium]|nr:MAG: hypothetical protein EA412_09630 [Chitinophagaceae bacterium]
MKAITFLFLTVFIMFSACNRKDSPEEVATKFLTHLSNNEVHLAKRYATRESGMMLDMVEGMRKSFGTEDDFDDYGGMVVKTISCEIEGNYAKCTYCCNQAENEDEILLRKVDGEWLAYLPKD